MPPTRRTTRLVKKTEAFFRVLPDTIPTFDHFTPSAKKTLDRAERLFTALNALKA
jgi:hypothetical protein